MESSLITGRDVATIAAAPTGQDVRKRWLLLALALVVGLVAAFAIGSAVKHTSAPPAPVGSLAQSSSASGQHANITPLTNAGAVPALHAPPPKPKTKTTPATSASSSSPSVASSSVASSPSTQSSSPAVSSPSTSAGSTSAGGSTSSGGSTSAGTSGTSQGGGGGQNAG